MTDSAVPQTSRHFETEPRIVMITLNQTSVKRYSATAVVGFFAALVLCLLGTALSHGQSIYVPHEHFDLPPDFDVRSQDELWIVSARDCATAPDDQHLIHVHRYVGGALVDATLDDLAFAHQIDRERTTSVYVHGNQTDGEYGIKRGLQYYENISNGCQPLPPLRFVLWLWKSERELKRLYPDFRIKSARAVKMGRTFAQTLTSLGDQEVVIVGFSLGAQVIFSALDQLEGAASVGETGCRACDFDGFNRIPTGFSVPTGYRVPIGYRVALIAPAVDPNYACNIARRTAESTLTVRSSVFFNRSDRAVKALRIIVRRECPEAQVSVTSLVENGRLFLGEHRVIDISKETGCKHSIVLYSKSKSFQSELCKMTNEVAAETRLAQIDSFSLEAPAIEISTND